MRLLIVGEGKSGTTALMKSAAAAIPHAQESFEPLHLRDVTPTGPVVAKKLLASWDPTEADYLSSYDRIVYIVRDPRDRLVSHLLYDAYNRGQNLTDPQTKRWIKAISRKVARPTANPIVRLMDIWWQMTDADLLQSYIRSMWRMSSFRREFGDQVFTYKYEDLVAARFDELNHYLSLELAPATVSGDEQRVLRSGTDGDWRHWFTSIDVNVFRSSTTKWLRRHGYDHHDWELAETPAIDPDTSTKYVRDLLRQVRSGS